MKNNYIIDPKNGIKYGLNSDNGKYILNKHLERYMGGSQVKHSTRSRCQAYTQEGKRCKRKAVIRQRKWIDDYIIKPLTGDKEIKCCSLCWQHFAIASGLGIDRILDCIRDYDQRDIEKLSTGKQPWEK